MSGVKQQLLLCKFLYLKGVSLLAARGHYDAGLAVSTFQDAVELALFASAAQLGATPKRNGGFADVWNACDDVYKTIKGINLPLKLEMERLNNARIAFKHYGNLPNAVTCEEHRRTAGQFLTLIFTEVFSEDFTTYSIVVAVENQQEQDALHMASNAIDAGDHKAALRHCADALHLIRQRRESLYTQSVLVSHPNIDSATRQHIANEVTHLRGQIRGLADILFAGMCGIDEADYSVVTSIVPRKVGATYENEGSWDGALADHAVRRCVELIAQYSIGLSERLDAPRRILGEAHWLY